MEKQVIVTIGRESGSGGLEIARKLGERLGVIVYDQNIFEHIGERFNMDTSKLQKYDETPRMKGLTRTVNGYSNSVEEQVVELQRKFIREKAEEGESFVILGRAGIRPILDYPCILIRIFIKAEPEFRVERVMVDQGMDKKHAEKYMNWVDLKRKSYHNQFCHVKWGDPDSYDVVIKSDKLGIDGTVDILEDYIRKRMEK